MKYKTFKKIIESLLKLNSDIVNQDEKLSKIFGEDSVIINDLPNEFIESTLVTLAEDLGDEHEVIDWLFWESLSSIDGPMTFYVNDVEFLGTIENIYLDITGELNLSHSVKELSNKDKEIITQISEDMVSIFIDNLNKYGNKTERMNMARFDSSDKLKEYEDKKIIRKSPVRVKGYNLEITLNLLNHKQDIITIGEEYFDYMNNSTEVAND